MRDGNKLKSFISFLPLFTYLFILIFVTLIIVSYFFLLTLIFVYDYFFPTKKKQKKFFSLICKSKTKLTLFGIFAAFITK